jgi:hypothetical protein
MVVLITGRNVMYTVRIAAALAFLFLSLFGQALAQGTKQPAGSAQRTTTGNNNSGNAVATHPSNNPFQNPIGQGVPSAANANAGRNSSQTNGSR